jgi:hypothetical protein
LAEALLDLIGSLDEGTRRELAEQGQELLRHVKRGSERRTGSAA